MAKHHRSQRQEERYQQELLAVIGRLASDRSLLHDFFKDLLTPIEYQELARRWQIVKLLADDVPQRDIVEELGVAVATVTRGSRMLGNPSGGFTRVLARRPR